jgi:Flp pilus assembly pilin Flp
MLNLHPRLGQSATEYAVVLIIVLVVLVTVGQGYFKHGVMGRVRESAREIGESGPSGDIEQPYYPKGTTGNSTRTWRDRSVTQTVLFGVDQGGNMTNSDVYDVRGSALTTGNSSYSILLNESLGAY